MDFSKIKKYFNNFNKDIRKNQKKQFSFFITSFVIIYLLMTFFVSPFEMNIKAFVGVGTEELLNLQGLNITKSGFYEGDEQVYSFFISEKQVIISWLCTGFLEIIILLSAIIVSFGVGIKEKIIGCIIGFFAGIIFNFARIWITINIILTQEAIVFEFAHNFLFRIILFLYIIGFYVIWFLWSEGKLKLNTKKIN